MYHIFVLTFQLTASARGIILHSWLKQGVITMIHLKIRHHLVPLKAMQVLLLNKDNYPMQIVANKDQYNQWLVTLQVQLILQLTLLLLPSLSSHLLKVHLRTVPRLIKCNKVQIWWLSCRSWLCRWRESLIIWIVWALDCPLWNSKEEVTWQLKLLAVQLLHCRPSHR